jgi:hypothetical protein
MDPTTFATLEQKLRVALEPQTLMSGRAAGGCPLPTFGENVSLVFLNISRKMRQFQVNASRPPARRT